MPECKGKDVVDGAEIPDVLLWFDEGPRDRDLDTVNAEALREGEILLYRRPVKFVDRAEYVDAYLRPIDRERFSIYFKIWFPAFLGNAYPAYSQRIVIIPPPDGSALPRPEHEAVLNTKAAARMNDCILFILEYPDTIWFYYSVISRRNGMEGWAPMRVTAMAEALAAKLQAC